MAKLELRGALAVLALYAATACSSTEGDANGAAGASGSGLGGSGGASSGGTAGSGGSAVAGTSSAGSNAGGGGSSAGGSGGTGTSGGASGSAGCGPAPSGGSVAITECAAAPGGSAPEAASALSAVNFLRARMGLPCMELVSEISDAAQLHCDYYQQNQDVGTCTSNAHAEMQGCAGFVAQMFSQRMELAGYDGSPRSEVMAFSGNAESAVAQWVNSVYHRTPLLSPWIRHMGYGGTEECDTIDMGAGPETPDDVTAVYPYPGQTDVPVEFHGDREGPMPPMPPNGWPSASPVHLYAQDLEVTSHTISLSSGCADLPHEWLPEDDHYILYPYEPFAAGTSYRVIITGTLNGAPRSFDWTFTTE